MRRNDREVESHDWMMEVLDQGQWMELALAGKDGWPYIVPLNYGFSDDFIIIHCAKEGKKIDLLRENNKVAFNVAVDAEIIRHEEDPTKFSMKYKSVSGRGIAEFIEDRKERGPRNNDGTLQGTQGTDDGRKAERYRCSKDPDNRNYRQGQPLPQTRMINKADDRPA